MLDNSDYCMSCHDLCVAWHSTNPACYRLDTNSKKYQWHWNYNTNFTTI